MDSLHDDLQGFIDPRWAPTLMIAQDPERTAKSESKIWILANRREERLKLDRPLLERLLHKHARGELMHKPRQAHAVLIQKILAIVTDEQKIEIIRALAQYPAMCKALAFSPGSAFVTSQIQLEGLVAWANDDAADVFSPGAPTGQIDEWKACVARSALEFIAVFVIGDARQLESCIEDKHCNYTFSLWLQLLIRLVRRGT